jgi:hypothetical protein
MSTSHRIDVRQHVVPPFWAEALPGDGRDPQVRLSNQPERMVL